MDMPGETKSICCMARHMAEKYTVYDIRDIGKPAYGANASSTPLVNNARGELATIPAQPI
jgi:hypothetical protein